MYHVSAHSVDERMISEHYYYYSLLPSDCSFARHVLNINRSGAEF